MEPVQNFQSKEASAFLFIFILFMASCTSPEPRQMDIEDYQTWNSYLGDKARTHYSSLDQINRENIQALEVAWTFSTNDAIPDANTEIQNNPLIIDGDSLRHIASAKIICTERRYRRKNLDV
jgi:glucose dehydrogenase